MEKEEKSFFAQYKEPVKIALEDLKTKGRRHKQIPNILTLLRLTAPAVIIPAALLGNIYFIGGAIIFYSLTDLADGKIARKWELISKLGADLDALADKLFAGTLLLAASVTNPFLLLNVGLEMAIAGININQKAKGKEAASTLMGKIKTGSLFPLAGAGILSSINPMPTLVGALAVTTTALQALTIGSYLKKYNKANQVGKNVKSQISQQKLEQISDESKQPIKEKEIIKEDRANTNIEELQKLKDELLSTKTFVDNNQSQDIQETKTKPKVFQKK